MVALLLAQVLGLLFIIVVKCLGKGNLRTKGSMLAYSFWRAESTMAGKTRQQGAVAGARIRRLVAHVASNPGSRE